MTACNISHQAWRAGVATVLVATCGAWAVCAQEEEPTAGSAAEQESAEPLISASAEATWGNKYIFRGIAYTDDFTLFPGVSVGAKGLSLTYWGAIDQSGDSDYVESDYGIDYTVDAMEKLSVTGGYLYYDLPTPDAGDGKTQEVFLTATYDTILSPTVSWYWDFDDVEGHYLSVGGSHSWSYGKRLGRPDLAVDFSASLGFSVEYTNQDESGLNDVLLGAALPVPLNDYAQLTGLIQYSIALEEVDDAGGDDELFFGGTVGVSF